MSAYFCIPMYVMLQSDAMSLEFVTLFLNLPLVHVPDCPTCSIVLRHACHTYSLDMHAPYIFRPCHFSCCAGLCGCCKACTCTMSLAHLSLSILQLLQAPYSFKYVCMYVYV